MKRIFIKFWVFFCSICLWSACSLSGDDEEDDEIRYGNYSLLTVDNSNIVAAGDTACITGDELPKQCEIWFRPSTGSFYEEEDVQANIVRQTDRRIYFIVPISIQGEWKVCIKENEKWYEVGCLTIEGKISENPIVKIISREISMDFDYDRKGRVQRIREESDGEIVEYNFTYTDNSLTVEGTDGGNTQFWLDDKGRVISMGDFLYDAVDREVECSYNSQGYLSAVSGRMGSNFTESYSWKEGNLARKEFRDNHTYRMNYTPSAYRNTANLNLAALCEWFEWDLQPGLLGLLGKRSEYLPADMTLETEEDDEETTFSYTEKEGYITDIIMEGDEDEVWQIFYKNGIGSSAEIPAFPETKKRIKSIGWKVDNEVVETIEIEYDARGRVISYGGMPVNYGTDYIQVEDEYYTLSDGKAVTVTGEGGDGEIKIMYTYEEKRPVKVTTTDAAMTNTELLTWSDGNITDVQVSRTGEDLIESTLSIGYSNIPNDANLDLWRLVSGEICFTPVYGHLFDVFGERCANLPSVINAKESQYNEESGKWEDHSGKITCSYDRNSAGLVTGIHTIYHDFHTGLEARSDYEIIYETY